MKLLTLAAVILFGWVFSKSMAQPSGGLLGNKNIIASGNTQSSTTAVFEAGFLGGPLAGIEQILFNAAQSAPDLSVDDIQEDSDLVFVQENSLVGSNSPNPSDENIFSKFRKEVSTYAVQSGDNPEKIGVMFGISADTILQANNLKDGDLIRPGDNLLILPINGIRIKVASKDSAASLAKKYQGKADEIIAFNNLGEDGLKAGEYLIIPGGEMPAPAASPKIIKPKTPKYAASTTKAGSWLIIPATGSNWGRVHSYNGVDVANVCGTPIYAAAAGKVILSDSSGWNGGYGKYVKVQHSNGTITLYAHASSLLVGAGEQVAQGQIIAYMGTTGRSTGCHLHFEVRGATNPLAKK